MAPAARDFEIGTRDIPILIGRYRSAEAVSDKVEQITLVKIIRHGERVEVTKHNRIIPEAQGIHGLNLGGS